MRVLIVDDHDFLRAGIRQLVAQEWPGVLIDEAPTIAQALLQISVARPDVVTLDLSLPDSRGTDGLLRLRHVLPDVPLLVLSLSAEPAYAARLVQLGASGCLPKDRAPEELAAALHALLGGERYVRSDPAGQTQSLHQSPI